MGKDVVEEPRSTRSPYAVPGGPPTAVLLRLEDAAARLGCSPRSIRELIDQGRLRAKRLSITPGTPGQLRIHASHLAEFAASLEEV